MAWLNREKAPISNGKKIDPPSDIWLKCEKCSEIIFQQDFIANQYVCPKCQYHYSMPVEERIRKFLDTDTFEEYDGSLMSNDPLNFCDSKPYKERLSDSYKKTKRLDAIVCGRGLLMEKPVHIGVFDFSFMGGSMGAVVGEKVTRVFKKALESKEPAIIFSSSGGARMQEGIISLMQMAKTCAMLAQLKEACIPYISILTHPTTGGVAASFAMLGDINIAEPGALIGFAGPRVIQQTIKAELPPGFQRSAYLLEHGMLDMICHRDSLRFKVFSILDLLYYNKIQ